jgi:hypothetical protein
MKRAVAQFLGGRQAEASTTAESMWNRGMWAAAARRAGVLGWWYSATVQSCPSQILDHSGAGQGEGGKDCREALAGARWPG